MQQVDIILRNDNVNSLEKPANNAGLLTPYRRSEEF
jgi:hypothetical protein